MKSKFNMIGKREHDIYDERMSYAIWLKDYEKMIISKNKSDEAKNINIEERLSKLEKAVFGEYDDGK